MRPALSAVERALKPPRLLLSSRFFQVARSHRDQTTKPADLFSKLFCFPLHPCPLARQRVSGLVLTEEAVIDALTGVIAARLQFFLLVVQMHEDDLGLCCGERSGDHLCCLWR